MTDQTQLPFFSAGGDLPLFSQPELAPDCALCGGPTATPPLLARGVPVCGACATSLCECAAGQPLHLETRQCQYDKALASLERRRTAGAMTKDGFALELANLNADYPECTRDYPPDEPDTIIPAGLEDTSIDQIW